MVLQQIQVLLDLQDSVERMDFLVELELLDLKDSKVGKEIKVFKV